MSLAGKRFESTSGDSFSRWLQMRIREGGFERIDPAVARSVVMAADDALIRSYADVPRVTWIGHATVLVQYKGVSFLTDPHLTLRPGPFNSLGPVRLTPPAVTFDEMPSIDFVVISHNHFDHLDHRTVDKFGDSVLWYVPVGLKRWFVRRGISSARVVELDWWGSHSYREQVTVTFTPAVHWSKRTPWDTNQSHWGSWSVRIDGLNTWFAGDTAYNARVFDEIGERTGPYDLSFIPIGAYAPRYFMLDQHIDPAQAVLIHQHIRSARSIAIHWGTFQLTHEPFLEPPELLRRERESAGLREDEFHVFKIGQTGRYALRDV